MAARSMAARSGWTNAGCPSTQRQVVTSFGQCGASSVQRALLNLVASNRPDLARNSAVMFCSTSLLTRAGVDALSAGHFQELGELMNLCQGYLNALQLSTPELEDLIHIARENGALGAKLTGGGGGGSMVAICPDCQDAVVEAMEAAGYKTFSVTVD